MSLTSRKWKGLMRSLEAALHLLQLGWRLEVDAARGVFALLREYLGEGLGDLLVAQALFDFVEEAEVLVELRDEFGEGLALDAGAAVAVAQHHSFGGALHHHLYVLTLVLDVLLEAALLDLEERRLRDVDVAALDEFRHVAEEEGEQQGADVRSVHVGIGHQDQLAVAKFG